jgi:hypothetical protein
VVGRGQRRPVLIFRLCAGDLDAARGHLAEALDIARALNARSDIVYEMFNLGLAEYLSGSPEVAEALFAETPSMAQSGHSRDAARWPFRAKRQRCSGLYH